MFESIRKKCCLSVALEITIKIYCIKSRQECESIHRSFKSLLRLNLKSLVKLFYYSKSPKDLREYFILTC